MSINIFSGFRRVALLTASIMAIYTTLNIINARPYLGATYAIAIPGGEFSLVDSCPDNAAMHLFSHLTPSGKRVSITLCLLTAPFGVDRTHLVPYRVDETGRTWGAAPYTSEVQDYEKQLEENFYFPAGEVERLEGEYSRAYRDEIKFGLLFLVGGLVLFWIAVWTIGWIMRGFLGIPLGRDRKPEKLKLPEDYVP